jgi:hypothetical protein
MCPIPYDYYPYAVTQAGPSTFVDNHYGTGAGSSFAAPFVSGALALVWCKNPGLSASEVMTRVVNSATDIGSRGWDISSGYGLLNLEGALAGQEELYKFEKTFNSPNPFYPEVDGSTNITLVIDSPAEVELSIFDSAGHPVFKRIFGASSLKSNASNPQYKSYFVSWDGKNGEGHSVVTGVYPYWVKVKGVTTHNKIAVIRGRR